MKPYETAIFLKSKKVKYWQFYVRFNLILIFSTSFKQLGNHRPTPKKQNSPVPQSAQTRFLLYCPCARQSFAGRLTLELAGLHLCQRTGPHTEIWVLGEPTMHSLHHYETRAIFPPDGCLVHQPRFCPVLFSQEYDLVNSLEVKWLGPHAFTSHRA